MHGKSKPLWDDLEGSDDDDGSGLRQEWGARREEFFNTGYREGMEAGKEEAVQQGFNAGGASSQVSLGQVKYWCRSRCGIMVHRLLLFRLCRGVKGWLLLGSCLRGSRQRCSLVSQAWRCSWPSRRPTGLGGGGGCASEACC